MGANSGDDECHVFWAQVDAGYTIVWRLLDTRERERARQLRHAPARARFVLGRGLARIAIARLTGMAPEAVRLVARCKHCGGPHGRLTVTTGDGRLHLSISHSGARVGIAVARDIPCGLDVERVALRGGTIPVKALSSRERTALQALPPAERTAAFICTWTRKEAVLKATGDGLLLSPADLTVSMPWEPTRLIHWADRPPPHTTVHLHDLDVGPRYRASLATLGTPVSVVEHDASLCWLAEMTAPL